MMDVDEIVDVKIERELLWWRRLFGRVKEVQNDHGREFGAGCLWLA